MIDYSALDSMSLKVESEIRNQFQEWGDQDHPLIGGTMVDAKRGLYAARERDQQHINRTRVAAGNLGWDSILLEEVFEALSAKTPARQIEELVQVAAVAINAALAIKRAGNQ